MIPLLFSLVAAARADEVPCARFATPTEVVEAAMRVDGARRAGDAGRQEEERERLVGLLACVSDPLGPAEAGVVHDALAGSRPPPAPPPGHRDWLKGPPRPDGGVALVDGVAHAALRPSTPAVVQAFDADGRPLYSRWLDADGVDRVRAGTATMPTSASMPRPAATPLTTAEKTRLFASAGLVAASAGLLIVAADARADWYEVHDAPVDTVAELDALRSRANLAQGAGLAAGTLGAAGLLTVIVRVPF